MSTMTATKQNNFGEVPEPKIGASLNYHDGKLYLYGLMLNSSVRDFPTPALA